MTSFSCKSAKSCACQRIMEPIIIPVIVIHCQKVGIFAKEKEEVGAERRSWGGIGGINIDIYLPMLCMHTHTHTHGARNHGPLTYVSRSLCVCFSHSTYPRATAWSSLGTHHPQVWQSRNWKWVCAVNNLHSRNYSLSHLLYPVTCYSALTQPFKPRPCPGLGHWAQ